MVERYFFAELGEVEVTDEERIYSLSDEEAEAEYERVVEEGLDAPRTGRNE